MEFVKWNETTVAKAFCKLDCRHEGTCKGCVAWKLYRSAAKKLHDTLISKTHTCSGCRDVGTCDECLCKRCVGYGSRYCPLHNCPYSEDIIHQEKEEIEI